MTKMTKRQEDEENKEDDSDGGMDTFELPVQNGRAFGAELILKTSHRQGLRLAGLHTSRIERNPE